MAGPQMLEFLRTIAERLFKKLADEKQPDWKWHQEVVNCLASLAQTAASCDDFELVHRIGLNLERSRGRNNARHADCCGRALGDLLTPGAAERLVELYLEKRDDLGWARIVAPLLKWLGLTGAEKVFERLEKETVASNRMRLMRLFTQLGPARMEAARKRLADERWYVLRNACYVMGDTGDPGLPSQLRAALRHPDVRVQQAAVNAIIRSEAPDRARVLAESLPYLKAHVQEMTLFELTFLKDPRCIEGLEQLILTNKGSNALALERAVRVLATIPSARALEALGKVLFDAGQALPVRKAALEALNRSPFALARRLLAEFAHLAPSGLRP